MDRFSISQQDLKNFLGNKKSNYYLSAWHGYIYEEEMERKKEYKMNYAAFFLNIFWCIYRKMYLCAIALAATNFAIMTIFENSFGRSLTFGVAGAFSVYANKIYYYHTRKKILNIKMDSKYNDDVVEDVIFRKGGTNLGGVIGLSVVYVAIVVLAVMSYTFLENNGSINNSSISNKLTQSNSAALRNYKIEDSCNKFLQSIFDNDANTAAKYSFFENGTDLDIMDSVESVNMILNAAYGMQQSYLGIPCEIYYEVEDIKIINDKYARIQYSFQSNLEEEKTYFEMTLQEFNGTWKVNFSTFFLGLLGGDY